MNNSANSKTASLALAWAATLLLSILPDILFRELTGSIPTWLFAAKLAVIAAFLYLSLFWKPAKLVQRYFIVFLVLTISLGLGNLFTQLPLWQTWFPAGTTAFVPMLLGDQLYRMVMAGLVIGGLLLIGLQPGDFFLRLGNLNGYAEAMPEVGVNKPTTWRPLGLRLSLYAFIALLLVVGFFALPSINLEAVWAALPLLPFVLVFAATNSFYEELVYRAAMLAPIHRVLGPTHALLIAAAFFGIGHFYGVPSGVIGSLATGFFGWILGRSMLGSKGMFWPWFIHFWADVVVFSFVAIGAVTV
jgi:membrane protease YdiL (CAAX protease family)